MAASAPVDSPAPRRSTRTRRAPQRYVDPNAASLLLADLTNEEKAEFLEQLDCEEDESPEVYSHSQEEESDGYASDLSGFIVSDGSCTDEECLSEECFSDDGHEDEESFYSEGEEEGYYSDGHCDSDKDEVMN